MAAPKVIFVAGGTGTQGGSVIDHLLTLSPTPTIRTLSRDLNSLAVKKLREQGVEVLEGSQSDKEAYKKGVAGAEAVFSVQTVVFGPEGMTALEADHAQLLADACKESGTVKHIVHSSVEQTNNYELFKEQAAVIGMTGYMLGKIGAENAVRSSGIKYTILRPASFSSNYFAEHAKMFLPGLAKGEYYTFTGPMSHIVSDDIGAFAVAAFQNSAKFGGREIELVGEKLSAEQIVDALEAASGKKIKLVRMTQEEGFAHPEKYWQLLQFFNNIRPEGVDPEVLKKEYPEVKFHTVKEFLIRHKDRLAIGPN